MEGSSSEFASARRQARRLSVFVGRGRELAALERMLLDTEAGSGGVVLVSGEPGVGKTRLLLEAAAAAAAKGWRVLLGHAYDSEGMPSYLPFIEALQDYTRLCPPEELKTQLGEGAAQVALILPEIGRRLRDLPASPMLDPESARYRLFESVSDFLEAIARTSGAGLLLCLDDLHWADKPSLLLLQHMARRLTGVKLFILSTYRTVDLDRSHPLAEMLADLSRERLYGRVPLDSLTRAETESLIGITVSATPADAVVEAIYSETNGNPFFVEEVVRHLQAEGRDLSHPATALAEWGIPEGVKQVLGRRLSRLTPNGLRLLQAGSVFGPNFDLAVLEAVTGFDAATLTDALEEALEIGLVQDVSVCRFSHPLVREAVYAELSLPRRQRLHLQIAEAIASVHVADLDPHLSALAAHFRLAGAAAPLEKTIDYSVRAAKAAQAVCAWDEAVTHYEGALQALELSGRKDEERRCDLLLALGGMLIPSGQTNRVLDDVAGPAFEIAGSLADRSRAAQACDIAMRALYQLAGNTDSGSSGTAYAKWAERADEFASPDSRERILADLAMADVHYGRGENSQAAHLRNKAIRLALRLGDRELVFEAGTDALGTGTMTPETAGQLAAVLSLIDAQPTDSLPNRLLAQFLGTSGAAHLKLGSRDEAERRWEQAWELSERSNDIPTWPCTRGIAGALLATMDGNFEAAFSLAADSARSLAAAGRETWANELLENSTRRALFYLGRASEVLGAPTAVLFTAGGRSASREALYLAASGRLNEARAILDGVADSRDLADSADQTTVSVLIALLDAAVLVGHHQVAEATSSRLALVSNMIWVGSPQAFCIARSLGDAAAFLGKPELARDYYQQAIEVCTKTRFRPELALSRLGLATVLLGNYPDERTTATEHLDFAIAEFEAMEMQSSLERALRLRGRRRPVAEAKTPAHPDGLSEREVEVLKLMATGKSNQQIADELIISFNTVQRHVGNILTKIGLRNRTEAAGYAHRHGIA